MVIYDGSNIASYFHIKIILLSTVWRDAYKIVDDDDYYNKNNVVYCFSRGSNKNNEGEITNLP